MGGVQTLRPYPVLPFQVLPVVLHCWYIFPRQTRVASGIGTAPYRLRDSSTCSLPSWHPFRILQETLLCGPLSCHQLPPSCICFSR